MTMETKYEKMTKSELLALAKENSITGRHSMNKEELVKALKSASKTTTPVMKKSGVKKVSKVAQKQEPAAAGYEMKTAKPKKVPNLPDYPIPAYYDKDMMFMFAVEPDGEYVYWEVSSATQNHLKRELGISECRYDLRVYTDDKGGYQMAGQAVGSRGDWYFRLYAPLKKLWAEIGVWDSFGRYHRVLRSAVVVMPSNIVSDNIDVNWMTVTDKWDQLYKLSGMDETFINTDSSMHEHILRRIKDHVSSKNSTEGKSL